MQIQYRLSILLILLAPIIPLVAQEQFDQKIFTGTFTSEGAEGIYLLGFNSTTGDVGLLNTFTGFEDPTYLRVSPDREKLFVATRSKGSDGFIQGYRIADDGSLTLINKQPSNGNGPCYVDVSPNGKYVAIATYGGGTTSLYRVTRNGSMEAAASVIQNEGSGPDKRRQSGPHAHSIRFTPDGRQAFSADLGTDRIYLFNLRGGRLVPAKQESLPLHPGAGPRHFEFHNKGRVLYVINELNSTVTAFKKEKGKWTEIQTISTIPAGFTGENSCADIHASHDGRFLYGSNRGHNSIAVFRIHPGTSLLEWVTSVPVQGDWPRNFTLSPDGKFMLVANQRSGNITVFTIDPERGVPEFTGKSIEVPAPVCLEFL